MDQPIEALTLSSRKLQGGAFEDASLFEQAQRVALCLVTSSMVPEQYRGKENIGNAVIAIDISYRLGLPVLMVMQNLHVIYGKPSWSGQMVIALINSSAQFTGPLDFEFRSEKGKDDWGCRCMAKKMELTVWGPWVDIAMAKAEGWYDKAGSKWKTIPEMMLRYRAAAYFGRTKCPEVMLGLHTRDEVEDMGPGPTIDVTSRDKPILDPVEPKKPREPRPGRIPGVPGTVQPAATPVPPPPSTDPHDVLWDFLKAADIGFDRFREFLTTTKKDEAYGFDATATSSVMDLPVKFCIEIRKDTQYLGNMIHALGKP